MPQTPTASPKPSSLAQPVPSTSAASTAPAGRHTGAYDDRPSLYFPNELLLLMERAGFTNIVVHGDHREEAPTTESDFVVFVAKKR
jgi:hypothetical protein